MNVTRETISASDDEKTRTVFTKITERAEETRTVLEFAATADPLVRVPGGHVLALGPELDRRPLSLGTEILLGGRRAKICDRDRWAARASGAHH